jgi:hypothetical protein
MRAPVGFAQWMWLLKLWSFSGQPLCARSRLKPSSSRSCFLSLHSIAQEHLQQ